MKILVTYASTHGATEGIAGRIADRLRAAGWTWGAASEGCR